MIPEGHRYATKYRHGRPMSEVFGGPGIFSAGIRLIPDRRIIPWNWYRQGLPGLARHGGGAGSGWNRRPRSSHNDIRDLLSVLALFDLGDDFGEDVQRCFQLVLPDGQWR